MDIARKDKKKIQPLGIPKPSRPISIYVLKTDKYFFVLDNRKIFSIVATANADATPTKSVTTTLEGVSRWKETSTIKHVSHQYLFVHQAKRIVSGFHWDNSFKVHDIRTGTLLASISHHLDIVTTIACNTNFLIVGSADTTISIWKRPVLKYIM